MAAVGQEHWEAESTLAPCDLRGHTARGRYSLNGAATTCRKHDHVVTIPRSAPSLARIAKRLRRPAASADFLELALREEPDVAAVGRPEGISGVLAARHRLSLKPVNCPQPELTLAIHRRRDCNVTPIRRNGKAVNAGRVFRQRDGVTLRGLRCGLLAEAEKGHDQCGGNADRRQYPRQFRSRGFNARDNFDFASRIRKLLFNED